MKQLGIILVSMSIVFLLLSNNIGRGLVGGPATTAPGETGQFCGSFGCHFSGSFDPETQILFHSESGELVDEYQAGQTYSVSIKINHTGFPASYGFQIVSLKESDNSPVNNFINLPQAIHEVTLLGRQYVEHSTRLPIDSIPLSWTAPEIGTGNVTFYAAGNAVNGNGSSSGDGADTTRLIIKEATTSSLTSLDRNPIIAYPNPVHNYLNIKADQKIYHSEIFDYSGRMLSRLSGKKLDLSNLEPGVYILKIFGEDLQKSTRIIKI